MSTIDSLIEKHGGDPKQLTGLIRQQRTRGRPAATSPALPDLFERRMRWQSQR
jgi:hypothetical protein